MRNFIKIWRSHGAKILVLSQIISFILKNFLPLNITFGIISLLFMTVPCGVMYVNKTKWLWYLRQIAFFLIGVLLLFLY